MTIAFENSIDSLGTLTLSKDKFVDDGDFIFHIGDKEVLRLCGNGRFFVEGRPVTTDMEVYLGFKSWLEKLPGFFSDTNKEASNED